MKPRRGDLIRVDWVDIKEDVTGDPKDARLARRVSFGLFLERRLDGRIPVLVTTTTADEGADHDSGWCAYPVACVTRVVVIQRAAARLP